MYESPAAAVLLATTGTGPKQNYNVTAHRGRRKKGRETVAQLGLAIKKGAQAYEKLKGEDIKQMPWSWLVGLSPPIFLVSVSLSFHLLSLPAVWEAFVFFCLVPAPPLFHCLAIKAFLAALSLPCRNPGHPEPPSTEGWKQHWTQHLQHESASSAPKWSSSVSLHSKAFLF